jgi:hypothetical protein
MGKFSGLTWSDFFHTILPIALIYYVVFIFLFYNREIKEKLGGKKQKSSDEKIPVNEENKREEITYTGFEPVTYNIEQVHPMIENTSKKEGMEVPDKIDNSEEQVFNYFIQELPFSIDNDSFIHNEDEVTVERAPETPKPLSKRTNNKTLNDKNLNVKKEPIKKQKKKPITKKETKLKIDFSAMEDE